MIRRAINLLALSATIALPGACETYRIEYRRRPAFYARMVDEPLPDRVVLDDGTILVYNTPRASGGPVSASDDANVFRIREEQEDGSIVLRALLPEHVIANTLHCLRNEEYELLWDQMLSDRTRRAYEAQDQGVEEFAAFFRKHRLELAKMLTRMRIGLATYEVVVDNVGDGVVECRFWPQVAGLFRFKKVKVVYEGFGLKLLMIE